jgi:zinc protease
MPTSRFPNSEAALVATAALLAGVAPGRLAAQQAAPAPAAAGQIEYQTYRLTNGLQVILSEDHTTPIAAVDVWYHVGSANERPGRAGFAHLFEHMMFQGSQHVAKTEHLKFVESVGGSANGSTTEDRTNYFETVPAERLNLALWLEADRMRSLNVTQPNMENQRKTVEEELRLRVANQPYSNAFLRASYSAPFDSSTCFAYAHTPIGSIHDLDQATIADVQAFHATYYEPNNATLAVVGDFDPPQVRALIQQYFGGIPRGKQPPAMSCRERFDPGIRVDTVMDPKANLPAVIWSYRVPAAGAPDTYPLALLASLFGQGQSSRIYRALVRQGAALQATVQLDARKDAGLLLGFAIANQGVGPDSLLKLVRAQVDSLKTDPPTQQELEKAKNGFEADFVMGRQRVLQKAEALERYAYFAPRLSDVNSDLARYLSVTRQDLQRVIDKYLTRGNLTVVIDLPAAGGGAPAGAGGSRAGSGPRPGQGRIGQ